MLAWDCPQCGQRVSSMLIPGSDGRARIADLEAEVARLKRELAARPAPGGFNTRPFTPVPKPGRK